MRSRERSLWKNNKQKMKNWSKVYKFKKYDILVQRLCNNTDGEHITATLRVDEGQLITTMSFGDSVEDADEGYEKYTKKLAKDLIDSYEKLQIDEKKDNNSKD